MEGTSLYDIITVVILGAAVIYYFLIPAADAAVDVRNKARNKQKQIQVEEESEGPE